MKHTTHTIAKALGRKRMMRALGVKDGAISAAVVSGSFPASWFLELRRILRETNVDITEADFEQLFRWKGVK